MRIAIMGTGGIGGFIGAGMAAQGADVLFIARGAHLAAMRANGFTLLSALGDVRLAKVEATDAPSGWGYADYVVFTVKGQDNGTAIPMIRPLVGPHTAIVSFQNGVEGPDRLSEVYGRGAVVPGTTFVSGMIETPGVVRHYGRVNSFVVGEWDNARSPRLVRLAEAGARAGLEFVISASIERELWTKLAGMASLAAATSLARLPMRTCAAIPETRRLIEDAIREVMAVATARGVTLPDDTVAKVLAFADNADPKWTTSMCTDLLAGKPLEIETISGAIHRTGAALGVPTPVHTVTYRALAGHASGGRATGGNDG